MKSWVTNWLQKKVDANKYDPQVDEKVPVEDKDHLTPDEKRAVEDDIRENNSSLTDGTEIEVGDNGDVTVTYPDGSEDTIPG
ncbi:hypothetical protein [Limosilactobacillus ingluviei]|uniref:hypothetical protein n=1 Tax=Limosilactobacillus ingluviei TaxID=148604 RepID=UPI001F34C728|nr:hypothetical protein [Limosilactobacillus ingluviei]